jgi:preprotein translocase SecE subunit
MRHQRYVLLTFVIFAILAGWVAQAALVSGFAQFAVVDSRHFGFLQTSTALSLLVGTLTFVVLIRNRQVITFSDEVVGELVQVAWPTRDETVRASTTVVMAAIFTSVLLGVYDWYWKNLADLFLFTDDGPLQQLSAEGLNAVYSSPGMVMEVTMLVVVVPVVMGGFLLRQFVLGQLER